MSPDQPNGRHNRATLIIVEIVSSLIGSVVSLLFGFEAKDVTKLPSWWMPAVFGVVGAFLAWSIFNLFRLRYLRAEQAERHRLQQQKFEADLRYIKTAVPPMTPRVANEDPIVFDLLRAYADRALLHITRRAEILPLEEYLMLLDMSLDRVETCMFATSLVAPSTFLANKNVMLYLKKQADRKQYIGDRLTMERVFICKGSTLDSETEKDAVAKLLPRHKDHGIKMGLCRSEDLDLAPSLENRYCRDFVYFESHGAQWLVDAGEITETAQGGNAYNKNLVRVQVVIDKGMLNGNWTETMKGIRGRTTWVGE
jgi:uncharacterized membrane protein YeaQ/YmgE (transglycosylase-associated protein family)